MSQTRQLEVLRQKRREGKFPSVKVSGEDYEFLGVQFGGASPTVSLAAPTGETKSRTVAEWKRLGAEFSARSRSLPRSYVTSQASPTRHYSVLTRDGNVSIVEAWDATQARQQHEAIHGNQNGKKIMTIDLVAGPKAYVPKPSGILQREIDAWIRDHGGNR